MGGDAAHGGCAASRFCEVPADNHSPGFCELELGVRPVCPQVSPSQVPNVWSEHKFVEKLRYIHRNPVMRGLVARPEDWLWSSFRHYAKGAVGRVEIESQWTARRREQAGIFPIVRKHPAA